MYLSWVTVDGAGAATMFRRGKLMLDAVAPALLAEAVERGQLRARLTLTDEKGNPTCAHLDPPLVQWSAAYYRADQPHRAPFPGTSALKPAPNPRPEPRVDHQNPKARARPRTVGSGLPRGTAAACRRRRLGVVASRTV